MLKKFLSIFIISNLTCFLFISCNKSSSPSAPTKEDPSEPVVPPLSLTGGEGLSSSIKLLKEKFKQEQNNLVVSGLSLDYATCMLANGVTAQSLKELESFFETTTEAKTNELSGKLQTIKTSSTLEISNSIWGNHFQEQYKMNMKNKLDVDVQDLPDNTKVINDWVTQKTHNKIQKLFEEGPTNNMTSYLVNTIFFKGLWESKFDQAMTRDREFTTLSGSKIQVKTMSQTETIDYAKDNDMESIRLTYADGGSMRIYLPKEGVDFNSFIQGLSKDKLLNMKYSSKKLKVFLPKFEIKSDIDVKAIFESLNIKKIFEHTNRDFGTMMTQLPSYVEDIKQKAVITVDEEGTVATAATGVTVVSLGIDQTPTFMANRPFLFYVDEGDFLGVYTGK